MWLLVDDAAQFTAAFEAARAHQTATGCTLELTGPWPPYHFVRTEALRDDPSTETQPAQPHDGAVEALR